MWCDEDGVYGHGGEGFYFEEGKDFYDMKKRLCVSRRLPDRVAERLLRDYDVDYNWEDDLFDRGMLLSRCVGVEGMIVCPTDCLDGEVIGLLPGSVRIIATYSVGYDHIDVEAARSRGIVVTYTPDVLTDATADLAFLLLLAASRDVGRYERMLRGGFWRSWSPVCDYAVDMRGKRLGILGMGRIGSGVARRARAFSMRIHYYNRERLPEYLECGAIFHSSRETFLRECDFLSLHAPLTLGTYHFLDREGIGLLPYGAIVVNTSRGGLVDDDALIEGLRTGRVGAAGLDVYEGEPNFHRGYLELDNVVLYPHIGSATRETRDRMGFMVLDNIDAVLSGGDALNPVG